MALISCSSVFVQRPYFSTEVDTDEFLPIPHCPSARTCIIARALHHPTQWHSHRTARQLAWQLATGIRTLAGIRGNCHITATLAPKTSVRLVRCPQQVLLCQDPLSVHRISSRCLLLRKYARLAGPESCVSNTYEVAKTSSCGRNPLSPNSPLHPPEIHTVEGENQFLKLPSTAPLW